MADPQRRRSGRSGGAGAPAQPPVGQGGGGGGGHAPSLLMWCSSGGVPRTGAKVRVRERRDVP